MVKNLQLRLMLQGAVYSTMQAQPDAPVQLPRLSLPGKTFLGWNPYACLNYGQMNWEGDRNGTLHAITTEGPAYVLESHFLDVRPEHRESRCQMRRYVIEVYLENAKASAGVFQIENVNHIFYYLGNIPAPSIRVAVEADTKRRGGPYHNVAFMTTGDITVSWESTAPIDATLKRQKLLTLTLSFSKWGMSSREVEKRNSDEIIVPSYDFQAMAGEKEALVSANFYHGVRLESPLETNDAQSVTDQLPAFDKGSRLCRIALMADTHIGERYGWENYHWLKGVYAHLEQLHTEDPLDFVLELGDTLDDGYAKSYEKDYATYLELVKDLAICDSENPIDGRLPGKIPHYELEGNHDTAPQTRFFRQKLWYSENKKVAFIGFFAEYGGYPAVNGSIDPSGISYRSYGVLKDEMVDFVDRSILEAKAKGAEQIVLCCHYGIAQDLPDPILPETGLGRLENLCRKYDIRLFLNGHEHTKEYPLRKYKGIYDYDAAMTRDKYAVMELYERCAETTIYNTDDHSIYRIDRIVL